VISACALLAAATLAIAWPIWRYQYEYSMFARRALLAGVTREESRVRRWLWAGRVLRVAQVFGALAWAAALVVLAHLFSKWHWMVLALDAALLAAVAGAVMRQLAPEVRPELLGIASRRWPLALGNVALLAIAFLAIDFFLGAPDTRRQAWDEVARQAFDGGVAMAACPAISWVVGALAAADALAWHAAEVLIPSLPNPSLKILAWLVFLLQAGVAAVGWTRALLGVGAFLDRRAAISSRPFFVTACLVAALLLALAFTLRTSDFSRVGPVVLAWTNPCRTDPATALALRTSLAAELEAARVVERERASRDVEAAVATMYGQVEKGADAYLDWYFTVLGEYERLVALIAGGLTEKMRVELESRLFGEGFSRQLDEVSGKLAAETAGRLGVMGSRIAARLGSEARLRPCLADAINLPRVADVHRDVVRASTAAATGAAVGTVAAVALVRRAAAAAAAKAATTGSFRSATTLAGRTAAKRGGSALGAGAIAAAACGPAVVLCASVAAIVTWIVVDKAFVEVDELLSRKEMRREILEAAGEQQAALAAALVQQQHAAIDRAIAEIDESIGRVFVPAREGI